MLLAGVTVGVAGGSLPAGVASSSADIIFGRYGGMAVWRYGGMAGMWAEVVAAGDGG